MRGALFASAAALLVVPVVAAATDGAWSNEPRAVSVDLGLAGFEFESRRETPLAEDEISGAFDAARARFTWSFASARPAADPIEGSATFQSVISFEDVDGNGALGFRDRILQTVPIANLASPFKLTETASPGAHGVNVRYVLNETSPGLLPGPTDEVSLTIRFTVPADPSSGFTPTSTRIGWVLEGFPVAANATHVALLVGVEPGSEWRRETNTLRSGGDTHLVEWRWETRTEAGIGGAPVASRWEVLTTRTGDEQATLAFAYARADLIAHESSWGVSRVEPQAGATVSAPLPPGSWFAYVSGTLLTCAIVALGASRRLRRS